MRSGQQTSSQRFPEEHEVFSITMVEVRRRMAPSQVTEVFVTPDDVEVRL
jgi:hypothetical protein